MQVSILRLPDELLVAITNLVAIPDLAALALTNRRLSRIASFELYDAAARDFRAARQALFYFSENGRTESVRLLLQRGVDPNVIYFSRVPRSCLHRALADQRRRPGRRPLIDRILAIEFLKEALPYSSYEHGDYCRLIATFRGEANCIPVLQHNQNHNTLLGHLSSFIKQLDRTVDDYTTKAEIDTLDDVYSVDQSYSHYYWTALHVAADRGDEKLAEVLLDGGAAVQALAVVERGPWDHPTLGHNTLNIVGNIVMDGYRQIPLDLAISNRHTTTAQLLLAYGSSTVNPLYSTTALHVAAWHGALELCKVLVDENVSCVNSRTSSLTTLHYAVGAGHLQTVGRCLVDMGADIRASFDGENDGVSRFADVSSDRDVFTHSLLLLRRYSDASVLLELDPRFELPRENLIHPVEACIVARNIGQSDEIRMAPILKRLLLACGQGNERLSALLPGLLEMAAENHLPRAMKLLLGAAEGCVPRPRGVDSWLDTALRAPHSNAAVETVRVLVDHGASVHGMATPPLSRVFAPVYVRGRNPFPPGTPFSDKTSLQLREPGSLQAKLKIAQWLYGRLAASPQGVDKQDLRAALVGACQPGGLRLCKWLSSLGALRSINKSDLVSMLLETAWPKRHYGGDDPELAEWVLRQADAMGLKNRVLASICVPTIIARSDSLQWAQVLTRHGARLDLPPDPRAPPGSFSDTPGVFSCHTRRRVPRNTYKRWRVDRFYPVLPAHVLTMVCVRADMDGAAELLRFAIDAAGENASELVNSVLAFSLGGGSVSCTPASLVCYTGTFEFRLDDLVAGAPSEPIRLVMLKMLLKAGAEVHTLVENCDLNDAGSQDRVEEEPSESLWQALASQDEEAIARLQQNSIDPPHPWRVYLWSHKPIPCAIESRMPTLVRAMLEARPLPVRNSPVALNYLEAACGSYYYQRLSPATLEIVLNMANIDHADAPVDWTGRTALLTLMEYCYKDDFTEDKYGHECFCAPDMIDCEKDDVSEMVSLLLARGAKWNTRDAPGENWPLAKLRQVLSQDLKRKSVYKYHNVEALRKRIVLDIYAEGVDELPDFNPFEMGDIKATMGNR